MPVRLVRVLMQLSGEPVTIELKNGSVVTGTDDTAATAINTHLKNVKITVKNRNPAELEQLSIRGGTIRFYVLPETANLDNLLASVTASKAQLKGGENNGATDGGRGRGGARGGRGGDRGGRGRGRGQ